MKIYSVDPSGVRQFECATVAEAREWHLGLKCPDALTFCGETLIGDGFVWILDAEEERMRRCVPVLFLFQRKSARLSPAALQAKVQ